MKKRAIHIFPRFANEEMINRLRLDFDPLASLIAPHLTLVFPFESSLSEEELLEHCRTALREMEPFQLTMRGITGTPEWYVYLTVKQGNDAIIDMHDRLYRGPLESFLFRKVTYIPHLTVGRLSSMEAFEAALQATQGFDTEFTCVVDQIVVERIEADESSTVENVISLGNIS